MKKPINLFYLLLITPLLSCCIFNDNSWKKEFGTPELFVENLGISHCFYRFDTKYDNGQELSFADEDLRVATAIKESGPFTKVSKRKPKSERYFTYEAYWQPATSGPNFCYLLTYDDGLMIIHHKNSLGPHNYLYFEIDEEKAAALNDLAFSYQYVEDNSETLGNVYY